MVKCMRKDKVRGDVALMELSPSPSPSPSHSTRGVLTRAKTLALQRSQPAVAPPSSLKQPDSCYLELRSRRLVKPPPPPSQNSRKPRQTCGCRGKENPNPVTGNDVQFFKIVSMSAESMEIEPCFGENTMDCQARERGSGESTPCSLFKGIDTTITPPLSATKRTCSSCAAHQRTQSGVNVPTPPELEELFAREERLQQHHFIEKYNFDIVNDSPLPGRYEWVTVGP